MVNRFSSTQTKLARLLAGRRQSPVPVRAKLLGRAGEVWRELKEETDRVGLGDEDLLALLLDEAYQRVIQALRAAPDQKR